ncbi:MAG: hypothetical protein R6U26_02675 [Candidatus Undinarchaeales archaeon]
METKSWIAIAVFAVLIIVGLFILLPILGIEMPDIGGYSAPGASYYGGEPAPTEGGEGGAGFNWGYLLIIPVIAVAGYLGFRNLKDSPFRLWFTPEGRKILKEKRRVTQLKRKEQLEQLKNLMEKVDAIMTEKLDHYKRTDKSWSLLELYRKRHKPIITKDGVDYIIKLARYPKGLSSEEMVKSIIRARVSDLKKDWKFGVYTDSIPDSIMEFSFLNSVIRWLYERMHQGELPELDESEGRLRVFRKFMGKRAEVAKELKNSNNLSDSIKQNLRSILEAYNDEETIPILQNCGFYTPVSFNIDPDASSYPQKGNPFAFEKVDELIQEYGDNPFKAIREYTVFKGDSPEENPIRNMVIWTIKSYGKFLQKKKSIHNIMEFLRKQDTQELLTEAIQQKKGKHALKKFKKNLSTVKGLFSKTLLDDLKDLDNLTKDLYSLMDNIYNWFLHRETDKLIDNIELRVKALGYNEGSEIPEEFSKRMAGLYLSVFMPWMYVLLTYKLLYVLVLKYLESVEIMQNSINEAEV